MSHARASTDEETAPLLDATTDARPASDDRLAGRARALTTIEKILAAFALLFLLLAAVFIGLFAGTANQLKKARHQPTATHTVPGSHATATVTATKTIGAPVPTGKHGHHNETCLTRECVLLASEILQNIDSSVDPCDDFYNFANGGWLSSHSIPSDRGSYGSFNILQDSNRKIILEVLEGQDKKPSKDDTPAEAAEKANLLKLRTGYRTCMDERGINKKGLEPMMPLIDDITNILGPFLVSDLQSTETEVEWEGTYSDDYDVPAHLMLDDAGRPFGLQSLPKTALTGMDLESRDLQDVFGQEVEAFSDKRKDALTRALAYTHSRGVSALIQFGIEGDSGGDDPQIQGLSVYQAGGGLPSKEYYEEKPILDLYTSIVSDVLFALSQYKLGKRAESNFWGFPWPKPTPQEPVDDVKIPKKIVKAVAKRVVKFERSLIRAGANPEDLFNPQVAYNPYDFHNLSQQLDFMSLSTYISTFAPRNFPTKIVVTHPPYIKSVHKILADTPSYVLSAYFVTRLGLGYSKFLGPATPVRQATRKLQVVLQGLKKGVPEDRQQFCQAYADELQGLGLLGGKEFVDRAFGGDSKTKAESVIYNIIDAFKARLPEVPWMDAESAKAAAKKADSLYVKIGYPTTPNTTDALALQAYYSRLPIDGDFFANGLRQRLLSETRDWMKLGRSRDRGEWEMQPQLVNAYYSPSDGEIVFPAGILRSPFFSPDWPLHLQYGAFGSVAAHELSHAFDNTGAQYDERGRLRDWWTNSTVKAFKEKAQCVARQYSNYSIPGPDGKPVYINGNLTNGEDLGDSGIVFAYNAWKEAAKGQHDAHGKLPGLNFTDDQLFFLASARVWAQLIKPESALTRIRTDPHSPNEWRSNGQVAGFARFAEAFHCKPGSKASPTLPPHSPVG